MKVAQLKDMCKELGLKLSGKKSELQDRIRGHLLLSSSSSSSSSLSDGDDPDAPPSISLNEADDFEKMSDDDLRHACAGRGIDDGGDRKSLTRRLRDDHAYSSEVRSAVLMEGYEDDVDGYRRISDALQRLDCGVAFREMLSELKEKEKEEPKFVDVTITSIGMKPDVRDIYYIR